MFNELKVIETIDLLFENKIVLYGAGYYGGQIYETFKWAGIPINYFCDSKPETWGKVIYGIEIISPEKLKELDEQEEIAIIITTDQDIYITQIMDTLEKMKLKTDKVLTMLGLEILFAQNANNSRINQEYRNFWSLTEQLRKERVSCKRRMISIGYNMRELSKKSGILVYQPGKVGSETIAASLGAIGLSQRHVHYYNFDSMFHVSIELTATKENLFKRLKEDKIIKIITLVREPLSRDYAHVFQTIWSYGAYSIISSGDSFIDACTKCIKDIELELSGENPRHGFEFDWFDRELEAVFGIDVFAHPFDREKGYSIIKQGNVEVLLMKLEKLNSLETVIGEFVGTPDFKLINANEGNSKSYKYLYKSVREVIKIPREIVSLYYDNNPRMNHFYTKEEQAAFLKKWENNIAD